MNKPLTKEGVETMCDTIRQGVEDGSEPYKFTFTDEESKFWEVHKSARKEKKKDNEKKSLDILTALGIKFFILNADCCHYRVEDYDFWPTTGKFYNQRTGDKGRGVMNLIKIIREENI